MKVCLMLYQCLYPKIKYCVCTVRVGETTDRKKRALIVLTSEKQISQNYIKLALWKMEEIVAIIYNSNIYVPKFNLNQYKSSSKIIQTSFISVKHRFRIVLLCFHFFQVHINKISKISMENSA